MLPLKIGQTDADAIHDDADHPKMNVARRMQRNSNVIIYFKKDKINLPLNFQMILSNLNPFKHLKTKNSQKLR